MSGLTYDLTLAGLSVGAAAALTGIGLVVTYRATGVLNFAHGAIAMVCAYVLRQCVVEWGWPLWAGAVLTLLVLAPGIGMVLERLVFRPMAMAGNDPARTLVASIGVFVLLVGGAALLWGQGARDDAPRLLPGEPWGQLGAALVLAAGVGAVARWTRFGRELRAVVDDRELAVLAGVDADRVAAAGWAFGAFTAGLTGVLLAPAVRLDPYGLPLLVMEVVAVAVAARMRSLPVAVVAALLIGVAQSQLTRLHPSGWAAPLVQAVGTNLFVVALLVAALALPRPGGHEAVLPRPAAVRRPVPAGVRIVAAVLFLLPLGLAGTDLHTSVQVPALAVVLLSLVVVTGRGGQISLGQAAYAGLGALFTALLAAGRFPGLPRLPELAALVVAVVLVAPLGLLTGRPAISRRGLAPALVTFAVGVGVSRFVFAQPYAVSGLSLDRPAGFDDDRAYYVLELALLAVALLAARLLRRGRAGRALAAIRDHAPGASAAGVRVPSLKLLAFVAGAALAALGGGMLGMGLRAFDPAAYDPVRSLLWFAAVMALGADSTLGALAAAALLVGLDAGTGGGLAAALIGVLATLAGRLPGGLHDTLRTATPVRTRTPRLTALGTRTRRRLTPGSPPSPAPHPTGLTASRAAGAPGQVPGRAGQGTGPELGAAGGRRREEDTRAGAAGSGEPTTPAPAEPTARPDTSGAPPRPPAGPETSHEETHPEGLPGAEPTEHGEPTTPPAKPAARIRRRLRPAGAAGASAERQARAGPAAYAPVGAAPPPARAQGPARAVLEARGLRAHYGGFTALDGVSLAVPAGGITAVVGPNGAGKSTLFHCLAGTHHPVRGQVLLGGRDVTRLPAHARTRLGVARTFQQLAVFPSLTVAENVRVGAEQGRVQDPAAVERALRLLGLDGPLRALPAAGLPTGTLRRVELARALAGDPRVLLLDEPAAGLDTAEVAALARILRALAADGTALLVVEHDLDLVADLADTVHVMAAGRIVASGPPGTVLDTAETLEAPA
ncbi:ATP-binding cassette domain-containing protein [Streptomyces sp. KAU_LT]|uniref:ABC transporter permease subunit n=1 Tax=Streptomyces sp. KAU_LT TaxID=3046669 RepID=UPI0024B6FACD|nr:ATP-binding cassette domain-containing protein [Streptomyces sp. KAU_LT]MDI9833912.1 ATP-binding cassette domain-containing protein [Streptomyces sp. KAU_LT]